MVMTKMTLSREDYMLALRNLSRNHEPEAYIRMLMRAQAFTNTIDFSSYSIALQQLTMQRIPNFK